MANEGVGSLTDFTGMFVGQPPGTDPGGPAFAGFFGLIDFVGFPVGPPPVAAPARGKSVGGKKVFHPLAVQAVYQSILDETTMQQRRDRMKRSLARLLKRDKEYKEALFKHNRTVLSAVVLSEL